MISQALIIAVLASVAMCYIPVVEHKAPQPYKFGYNIKDKHGEQYREETGDGYSGVKGSYGFVDAKGIKRQVNYVADKLGFRAEVKTNEPGTANQDPAAVKMISTEPYLAGGYGGMGLGMGAGAMGYGGGFARGGVAGGYGNLGYGGVGGGYGDLGYGGVGGGYGDLGYGGYGLY